MTIGASAIQLQASKLAQTASALVASVLLARTLGPTGLGEYASLLALVVVVQGLTSLGFEDLVLARGPLYGSDTRRARGLYRRTLEIRGAAIATITVVALAAFAGILPPPFGAGAIAFGSALLYAALNSLATLGAVIQSARVRPASSAALDATWALGVTATYAVLLVSHALTVNRALITLVAWQAAVDIGYLSALSPFFRGKRPHLSSFTRRESGMFWANGLLSIGVGKNSDVLAMQVAGASAAPIGQYNAAYNANLTASQLLVQGTGTMLYVGLGRVFATRDSERIAAAWRVTTVVGALLSLPLLVFCIVLPRDVLLALYGASFLPGASALIALAGTSLVTRALGGGSNQSILFLAERQAQVLLVRFGCVALNIALDIAIYPLAGILGVALVSGSCGVAITAIEFALSARIVPLRLPLGSMLRTVVPYAAAGLAARAILGDGANTASAVASAVIVMVAGSVLMAFTRPLQPADVPTSAPRLVRRILHWFALPGGAIVE